MKGGGVWRRGGGRVGCRLLEGRLVFELEGIEMERLKMERRRRVGGRVEPVRGVSNLSKGKSTYSSRSRNFVLY